MVEQYEKPLRISFEMPGVRLVSMKSNSSKMRTMPSGLTRRLVSWILSTRRRKFALQKDFVIKIDHFTDARLNGTLVIPAYRAGKPIEFDGASIPMPWLVAALSFDVLRPLGAVLIPSIVHDYLFFYGEVKVEGKSKPVTVDRQTADKLFLDLFQTVSGMQWWPWVAWVAVRAGAPFIPYAGQKGGLNKELGYLSLAVLLLSAFLFFNIPELFWLFVVLLPGLTGLDWFVNRLASTYQEPG